MLFIFYILKLCLLKPTNCLIKYQMCVIKGSDGLEFVIPIFQMRECAYLLFFAELDEKIGITLCSSSYMLHVCVYVCA